MPSSTDEMDSTTAGERNTLIGYCETCDNFVQFSRKGNDVCPTCKRRYSSAVGLQPTSKRTYDAARSKKEVAKWKKKAKK